MKTEVTIWNNFGSEWYFLILQPFLLAMSPLHLVFFCSKFASNLSICHMRGQLSCFHIL